MEAISCNRENDFERKRVLLIDDSDFMRFMQKDILTKNKYIIVGEAANGNEGVTKYHELKPDITIMNIDVFCKG